MNNTVFISTVGAKKKGLLPGGTGTILLPLIVLLKKDTLATSLAENHFLMISRDTQASSILSLPTERNLLSAMEVEMDLIVTSEVGRVTYMILEAEIIYLLTSRTEMIHTWISEVGCHSFQTLEAGIRIQEISRIGKGSLWSTVEEKFLPWIIGIGMHSI